MVRAIITRAAAPIERATHAAFAPETGSPDVAGYRLAWSTVTTRADRAAFEVLMRARGLDDAAIERAVSPVRLTGVGALPRWATDAAELCAALRSPCPRRDWLPDGLTLAEVIGPSIRQSPLDPSAHWAQEVVFRPLLDAAASDIDVAITGLGAAAHPVNAEARRSLVLQLLRRWLRACGPTFAHTITAADVAAGHPGSAGARVVAIFFGGDARPSDAWIALFGTYPVLARVMAVARSNWRDATTDLFRRLAEDAPVLAERFNGGHVLAALSDVDGDGGDPHEGGRVVSVLRFADGTRMAHKPKDLRVGAAYEALVTAANDAGLEPRLRPATAIYRDDYAWQEWVGRNDCTSIDQVRRYFARLGMQARLIQLLGGTDFIAENVVASGADPMLVDLEALITPQLDMGTPLPGEATRSAAASAAWDTPARGGIVTAKVMGPPGYRAADVSVLAADEQRLAPFDGAVVRRNAEGRIEVGAGRPTFARARALPELDGAPVRMSTYLDAVRDGYDRMERCLRQLALASEAPNGVLDAFATARVRLIVRNTHVYERVLGDSLAPTQLRDGRDRELALERLWAGHLRGGAPAAVVQAEIDALRDLDIPFFTAVAGSRALDWRHGTTRALAEPPLAAAIQRLQALADGTAPSTRDALESALFVLDPQADDRPDAIRPNAPSVAAHGAGRWRDAAHAVASLIVGSAMSSVDDGAPGRLEWVGLNYLAPSDFWRLDVLDDDLLTGASGVAVVLADVARVLGEASLAEVARGLVADRLLGTVREVPRDRVGGGFVGWGARAYACLRVARTLGDADLLARGAAAVEPFAMRTLRAPGDVIGGEAGLLLALASIVDTVPGIGVQTRALHAALEAHRGPDGRFPSPPHPALDGTAPHWLRALPSAGIAVRLAAARLTVEMTDAFDVDADGPSPTGDVLGWLAGSDNPSAALAAARVRLTERSVGGTAFDLLALGDVALTAYQRSADAAFLDVAAQIGGALLDGRARSGKWLFGVRAADVHALSAVTGTAAVAHFFARLSAPDLVASIRTLS